MIRSASWDGFRSVLCPVDFSEHSKRALHYAVAVARRGKAALRVVFVADPFLVTAASAALQDRDLAKRSALELDQFVKAAIPARTRSQVQVSTHVSIGGASEQILKAAKSFETDLIVLGTHGLTAADRLLIGSTTLSVLQRTAVPVLAVPRAATPGTPVAASWPGRRILAALDLDGGTDREVETAARIARWFGASLLLAHVVPDIGAPSWLAGDLGALQHARIERARDQMGQLAALAQRHAKAEVRVVSGKVPDEIAVLAAAERTELVLTVLRDRRRWFGAKRGSISYHVLSQAVTPVLAYPSERQLR